MDLKSRNRNLRRDVVWKCANNLKMGYDERANRDKSDRMDISIDDKGSMNMLHVGLLYTKKECLEEADGAALDIPSQENETAVAIRKALLKAGHHVTMIPATLDLLQEIRSIGNLDIIFNACTGITNKGQQANVVAMLELLGIPFIGSSLSTHIMGLHKHICKRVFSCFGIPTPNFQVYYDGSEAFDTTLMFPLIIKPVHEGSSVGISQESVVFTEDALMAGVNIILHDFHQPALVEEFIIGREFTIGIMGNEDIVVLPIEEAIYNASDVYCVMTEEIKKADSLELVCPAEVDEESAERMRDYAKRIYRALECREYARVDVRMDAKGKLYFIDLNTLPGLKPNYSDFPNVAEKAGYSYDELIIKILDLAWARTQKENSRGETATN